MLRTYNDRLGASGHYSHRLGFTLVEMLIAVAITLVMMTAVVTLFATLTESIRSRRAAMEMSTQMRHVSSVLQQDLAGHTCPATTWQRPDSNHGYIELIEGRFRDSLPSMLCDGDNDSDRNGNPDLDGDGVGGTDGLDPKVSLVPRVNGGVVALIERYSQGGGPSGPPLSVFNVASALGDYDDIIMLTSRNEDEPFVGRAPDYAPNSKGFTSVESPLAEVIWFAVENPQQEERARGFYGEPGMRTIYRRALLVAPFLDPYGAVNPNNSHPGIVRMLDPALFTRTDCDKALAALIAFQDQYDLSVRLEWDGLARNGLGQWYIIANTLGELTKRENRYWHTQFGRESFPALGRRFPWAIASGGIQYSPTLPVAFVSEPELPAPRGNARATAYVNDGGNGDGGIDNYTVEVGSYDPSSGPIYPARPLAYVDVGINNTPSSTPTAHVMLNDAGQVVRVTVTPAPLWGRRRGEDLMLSDVLAFDLRVFDPGAPLYRDVRSGTILTPDDPAWISVATFPIGNVRTSASQHTFAGQGAYVDMGYFSRTTSVDTRQSPNLPPISFGLRNYHFGRIFHTRRFTIYDTWSTSYENNGIDDDIDGFIDNGTDGFTNPYPTLSGPDYRNSIDVPAERETAPLYDIPLRGVQVILRAYERDSRQIRQTRVTQHFLNE